MFRKGLSVLLCLLMVLSIFTVIPFSVSAGEVDIAEASATSLPNSIFIAQAQNNTCTLAAATSMIRARAYLSGYSSWSSITESSVKPVAWTDSGGLWYSFKYSFSGNYVNISHSTVSGFTISSLKSLLNSHPEGIEIYCRDVPHAVLVTDYEGDTFYCADSNPSHAGVRRTLSSSLLGYYLGSQANILSTVDDYWYISSYSIVNDSNVNLGSAFYSTIENPYTGTALTGVEGNDVKSYALNSSLSQWWKFENCGNNNEYRITNCSYNKCIDVYCADNKNNTNVDLYTSNDTSAQRWYIRSASSGYVLVPKCARNTSNKLIFIKLKV